MIELTEDYWDCECVLNFIHPKKEESCQTCKARRDEQPDSRVKEVQKETQT